jgi:cell shape-determining protein MreC|tara:strand:+ start:265 stop:492 length:228 start_codon:yes stop_codon:yes gene_type:complete
MVNRIVQLFVGKTRSQINEAVDPLFVKINKGIDQLGNEVVKLRAENKELKKQLGLIESDETLVLTPDMEVKDGHK